MIKKGTLFHFLQTNVTLMPSLSLTLRRKFNLQKSFHKNHESFSVNANSLQSRKRDDINERLHLFAKDEKGYTLFINWLL